VQKTHALNRIAWSRSGILSITNIEFKKLSMTVVREWQAEQVRFSFFHQQPFQATDFASNRWWEDTFGCEAEQRIQKASSLEVMGAYGPGQAYMSISPGRVDWTLMAIPTGFEVPNLGDLEASTALFIEKIAEWSKSAPALLRIAYSAHVRSIVENTRAGYEALASLLPAVKIDIDNSSDFFYQINRPKTIERESGELLVNRLSKWCSVEMNFAFPVMTGIEVPSIHAVALELDINTDRHIKEPLQDVPNLLMTLTSLGYEIASHGDSL